MLTNELTYYQPTILCLQEVDLEQYEPYFVKLLRSLNYDHILLCCEEETTRTACGMERGKI